MEIKAKWYLICSCWTGVSLLYRRLKNGSQKEPEEQMANENITVHVDEETILKYIQEQEENDKLEDGRK